jgi:hypothetical protein
MDKQTVLQAIKELSQSGQISQAEVLAALHANESVADESRKHLGLATILYYIGGAIVFLGICVLVFQNWDDFNAGTKILATLGAGVAAYIVGAIMQRYEQFKGVGLAFFLISALVNPIGLYVTLDKMGLDVNQTSVGLLIFLIVFAVYLASFYFLRKIIFTLFSVIFGTIVFFFAVQWLVGENLTSANITKVVEYRFLATGLAYMFLGYYFKTTSQKVLSGVLYGFGSLIFLGAAMALGGWSPDQNTFWELIYPLLVFGIIFLSIPLKSKAFLTFGSLALIGYILKLTGEYFTSGLGWPLALVLAGLAVMGVGYYAVRLNKKYLTNTL